MTVSQGTSEFASARATPDDELAELLRDPQIRASLVTIATHAPTIAWALSAADDLLGRSRAIAEGINEGVIQLRGSATSGEFGGAARLGKVLIKGSPAIEAILASAVLQPEVIQVIGEFGEAALEADQQTRGRRRRVSGIREVLRLLRDPQIGETVAFVAEFAKALARVRARTGKVTTGGEG